MNISSSLKYYDEQTGELLIVFLDEVNTYFRLSSWADGLLCYQWKNENWEQINEDPELAILELLNRDSYHDFNSPIWDYICSRRLKMGSFCTV